MCSASPANLYKHTSLKSLYINDFKHGAQESTWRSGDMMFGTRNLYLKDQQPLCNKTQGN